MMKLHTVIARVADDNNTSIRLFESQGFQRIGVMREVGRKCGRLFRCPPAAENLQGIAGCRLMH